jgi:hypothetical protein
MTTTTQRSRGERGIAVIMTGLALIPLMVFAAFGVDLASWYSRISYIQKAADAAALAGTVWMPDVTEATDVACESLERNGITGGECGTGPFDITVERGSTATSLRVIVTDPDAQRYFSQVFRGQQSLTRQAEAEYNLPIPLGSPLNYFGGDHTRTQPPQTFSYTLNWPANANSSARRPAVAQFGDTAQSYGCNVGNLAAQGWGRWTNATTYNPTAFSGSTRCRYSVLFTTGSGTTSTPPPDYSVRAPTNVPCNVFQTPSGTNGRWNTGSPPTFSNSRHTSGTGNRQCTWTNVTSADVPPFFNGTNIPPGSAPVNQPCRVGYEPSLGWWNGAYSATGAPVGGNQSTGNRLCRWVTAITTVDTTPPNPIDASRSPGFWAMVEGPATVSTNGDAYSPRCYIVEYCGTVENQAHESSTTDVDAGYWYVVEMPSTSLASVDINVFDASYNSNGTIDVNAGDRALGGDSGNTFTTEFRVYQQDNLLDFTDHTPVTTTPANQTPGSCNWSLGGQTTFRGAWQTLCTITAPVPNSIYLVNVRTVGTVGNGINGYALEAESNNHVGTQPALYAYENMGMQNNNRCSPSPCTPPPATFYLAEVGPQYAGKTLVIDLWDPGDVSSGDASMFPKMPSTNVGTPRPVVDVPAGDCSYGATPAPNAAQTTSAGGGTGEQVAAGHASDYVGRCGVVTATGGARRLNGEWLQIRVSIPTDYACTLGINPELQGGSCWWGIEYIFSVASQDVTTWQARIEGNPVHLTQ